MLYHPAISLAGKSFPSLENTCHPLLDALELEVVSISTSSDLQHPSHCVGFAVVRDHRHLTKLVSSQITLKHETTDLLQGGKIVEY